MREILNIIKEEKFEFDKGKLFFCKNGDFLEKLEMILPCEGDMTNAIFEDAFLIQASDEKYTYGYITSTDIRMECLTATFAGTEEIHFRFDGRHMEKGDVCRGDFLIQCNRGEFHLPFEIRLQEEEILSSEGPVKSLNQFSDLAKVNWQEAVSIFYSHSFENLIREKEPQLYLCYRGLSAKNRNEHNVDQFLIVAGKKQRMRYYVEDSLLAVEDPEEITVLYLGILRNGWGYTRLEVETEGDFVYVEKTRLTDDDFWGNRYKLQIYIDSEKLHAGKNLGQVILRDNDTAVTVPIEVYRTGQVNAGRNIRKQKRRNNCRLTDIYQAFRLKEMSTSVWLKETDQLVQRMMTLDEEDVPAKLYFAQMLMTAERYNEAGWILENIGEEETLIPELEAYYLYLTSLLRGDEEYTKQVADRIERIYKEKGESWRAAWLLLYVSGEYEKSITAKWLFLEKQFEQGCRSPILYLEAMQLLNRNPSLLRKLERFELQVLYYGNKKGVLSPELLEQVYYLSGRVKRFSILLYKILANCYEKTKDERIVKEICTLLIKGNHVEKKYYEWFKLGIEAGVRITNLYEYYMMALDLEKEEEISKIALLYFTYQSNLDDAHTAYLYEYLLRKKEVYPDIFESYYRRMEGFVKEQAKKERMNEKLDKLYHAFLTEEMIQKQNAAALLKILFSYGLNVPNTGIVKAYVYQKDCMVPQVFAVTEKTVWLPIYGQENCVVWEDMEGNRFPAGISIGSRQDLAEHPIVKCGAGYMQGNPFLDLYLYEATEVVYEASTTLLERLFRLWEDSRVDIYVRREAAVRIMKYYYHTEDKAHLMEFLDMLPMNRLTRKEASEAIKYMVFCRMDDRAYEWMKRFSPVLVDSKISASLLTAMIKKKEEKADACLVNFAYETFEKGKYTPEILRYLAAYYEGTAYNTYQIWKAALACNIDMRAFSERLLVQMMFTDCYVEEHGEVFRKYLKDQPDPSLAEAYMIRRSYAYYLEGEELDTVVAEQILQRYKPYYKYYRENGQLNGFCLQAGEAGGLPVICELACLKYYSDRECSDEQESLLLWLLDQQLQSGIHLPWFLKYSTSSIDFSAMVDKTILEYHSQSDCVAKMRYTPADQEEGEDDRKIVNMYPVCRRVFFVEQILFFGESIPYEIIEETDGTDVVTESGVLKKEKEYHDSGRFYTLNRLLEMDALHKDKQFEALLEDYLKKDYMNGFIFKQM